MSVVVGKLRGTGKWIVCQSSPKNENYREYGSDHLNSEDLELQEYDLEAEPYNPELDSPSSWTTKSSNGGARTWCKSLTAAGWAQWGSNVLLVLLTIAGIVYGVLVMTGKVTLSQQNSDTTEVNDSHSMGGHILFGSIVGGAVSLILVNLSWRYRGKQSFKLQCCSKSCSCPIPQVASSFIVLVVGAILIPTYNKNLDGMLVIVTCVLVLLILINLPLLFVDDDDEKTERDENEELEVVPGNLESVNVAIPVEEDKKGLFYTMRRLEGRGKPVA